MYFKVAVITTTPTEPKLRVFLTTPTQEQARNAVMACAEGWREELKARGIELTDTSVFDGGPMWATDQDSFHTLTAAITETEGEDPTPDL